MTAADIAEILNRGDELPKTTIVVKDGPIRLANRHTGHE